jgi:uracil-DNA glycosylase family 4
MPIVKKNPSDAFSPDCKKCSRLAEFLGEAGRKYPGYYNKPVPSFGPARPRLLVVGLAPGLHGANRTGRPFTGDHAGVILYRTLHAYGFASTDHSISTDDGLHLIDCRITNAVRCVPPQNKPTPMEVRQCNSYLQQELAALDPGAVVLALGSVAHTSVLRALGLRQAEYRFLHGAQYALPGATHLIDSYHCSRYNTQTRRLTEDMFRSVFNTIRAIVEAGKPPTGRNPG